jgi:hypothetical protein
MATVKRIDLENLANFSKLNTDTLSETTLVSFYSESNCEISFSQFLTLNRIVQNGTSFERVKKFSVFEFMNMLNALQMDKIVETREDIEELFKNLSNEDPLILTDKFTSLAQSISIFKNGLLNTKIITACIDLIKFGEE